MRSLNVIATTFYEHYDEILNFYNHRSSNAKAESFNAKIKLFRANLSGVADKKFFLFHIANAICVSPLKSYWALFFMLILLCAQKKRTCKVLIYRDFLCFAILSSGETGIRTPGASQHNGFQDRRNRPLCHLSKTSFSRSASLLKRCKGNTFFLIHK